MASARADFRQVAADLHDDGGIAPARRSVMRSASSVPGRTVRMSSPCTTGVWARVQQPLMRGHARHHLLRVAVAQAVEQIHRRAVEERVALAEQRYVLTRIQPFLEPSRRSLRRTPDPDEVARIVHRDLGRERILEPQFLRAGPQMTARNGAGVACPAALGEIGDHRHRTEHARGLHRHQLRVARPHAERVERAPRARSLILPRSRAR